jgi:hypothetical protein
MRKVFAALMLGVPVMGAIYGLSVCHAQPVEVSHRLARMANDLPAFLNYQPTDGATRGGAIRRDMRLGQIN